jgi:hypothetical protein
MDNKLSNKIIRDITENIIRKTDPSVAGGTLPQPLGRHVTAMLTKETRFALFQISILLGVSMSRKAYLS